MTDAYADIAQWYDIEHDQMTDDIECLLSLITAPPGARPSVLEIGSGTGRVLAAIALAGHHVTGVEPSEAMRARCAARLARLPERTARRIRVVAGSATDPHLDAREQFGVALLSLNTFAHLTSLPERHHALEVIHRHLHPDGFLILDLDLLGLRRLAQTAGQLWWQGTWPLPDSTAQVSHFVSAAPAHEPGQLSLAHFYDVSEPGGVVKRTIANMPLALLSSGEVELALLHAGYRVEAIYGSYDLSPYEEFAPRAIFVARSTTGA